MSRWPLVVTCSVVLSGCQLFQTPPEPVTPEPVAVDCPAPPEPEACPEPVVIEAACPEPEPVVQAPVQPKPQPVPVATPKPDRIGANQLLVIGALERVTLDPPGVLVEARIDTGAETSSLHADNIVRFERDGERWVRFDLTPQAGRDAITLERPLARKARIKRVDGEADRRQVVLLRVQLGEIDEEIEVTLADRKDMDFPMLIGRNLLTDNAVVDVARKYTIR